MCSALSEIRSAFDDTKRILAIMKSAKRDVASFENVRCRVLHGEITIPKRYRSIIVKLFKKKSVKPKLVGEEFNDWLKQFYHTQVPVNMINLPPQPSYDDLFKFLNESGKTQLNNLQNQFLYVQCVYGYYLELFYQIYIVEFLTGKVTSSFKQILKENFSIFRIHMRDDCDGLVNYGVNMEKLVNFP